MNKEMSVLEKAGIDDEAKIYEGLHLSEDYIRNFAIAPESIADKLVKEGERHFKICPKCLKLKDGFLDFNKSGE